MRTILCLYFVISLLCIHTYASEGEEDVYWQTFEKMKQDGHAKVLESLNTRYETQIEAYIYWIEQECGLKPSQASELRVLLNARIPALKQRFEALQNSTADEHRNEMYLDNSPVFFATRALGAPVVTDLASDDLNKIFSEEQQLLYHKKYSARQQNIQQEMIKTAISHIDDYLFLTQSQRDQLLDELQERHDLRPEIIFGQYRIWEVDYLKRLQKSVAIPDSLLTERQRIVWLNLPKRAEMFWFRISIEDERNLGSIAKIIDNNTQAWLIDLEQILLIQADYLYQEAGWSARQRERAELACKGAICHELKKYREKMVSNLKTSLPYRIFYYGEESFGDFAWQGVTENPRWTTAILQMGSKDVFVKRSKQKHQAECTYMLALLDEELWLSENQKEELLKITESKLLQISQIRQPCCCRDFDYYYETFARLLLSISDEEAESILAPAQLMAWSQMKGFFSILGDEIHVQSRYGRFAHWKQ